MPFSGAAQMPPESSRLYRTQAWVVSHMPSALQKRGQLAAGWQALPKPGYVQQSSPFVESQSLST